MVHVQLINPKVVAVLLWLGGELSVVSCQPRRSVTSCAQNGQLWWPEDPNSCYQPLEQAVCDANAGVGKIVLGAGGVGDCRVLQRLSSSTLNCTYPSELSYNLRGVPECICRVGWGEMARMNCSESVDEFDRICYQEFSRVACNQTDQILLKEKSNSMCRVKRQCSVVLGDQRMSRALDSVDKMNQSGKQRFHPSADEEMPVDINSSLDMEAANSGNSDASKFREGLGKPGRVVFPTDDEEATPPVIEITTNTEQSIEEQAQNNNETVDLMIVTEYHDASTEDLFENAGLLSETSCTQHQYSDCEDPISCEKALELHLQDFHYLNPILECRSNPCTEADEIPWKDGLCYKLVGEVTDDCILEEDNKAPGNVVKCKDDIPTSNRGESQGREALGKDNLDEDELIFLRSPLASLQAGKCRSGEVWSKFRQLCVRAG